MIVCNILSIPSGHPNKVHKKTKYSKDETHKRQQNIV